MSISRETELKHDGNNRSLAYQRGVLYNWKAKYGGLVVSEAKRLKRLESENARLKKLLADAMLDNAALKELLGKKW
jgi:putative transposase